MKEKQIFKVSMSSVRAELDLNLFSSCNEYLESNFSAYCNASFVMLPSTIASPVIFIQNIWLMRCEHKFSTVVIALFPTRFRHFGYPAHF